MAGEVAEGTGERSFTPLEGASEGAPPPTGDDRVDAALVGLTALASTAVEAHVEVFDDVHRRLREVLDSIDGARDGPSAVPAPRPPGEPAPSGARHWSGGLGGYGGGS